MRHGTRFFLLLVALWFSPYQQATGSDAKLNAQVIAVIDGDTLLLKPLESSRATPRFYKLRLADIDAPEKDQLFGERAKRELESLVLYQQVRVATVATDRYGRRVGWVSVEGVHDVDINAELVQRGAAWASTWHQRQPRLLAAQQEAQRAGRGLWATADAVPPWIWRKQSGHHPGDELSPAFASKPLPSPQRD
ncbi:MAG: thermonuclease family protein [Thiobacillaceae bacterium]